MSRKTILFSALVAALALGCVGIAIASSSPAVEQAPVVAETSAPDASQVDVAPTGGSELTDQQKQTMLEYLGKHIACMRQNGFALPDPVVGPNSISVDLTGIPGTEPFDPHSRWFETSKRCDQELGIELPR